MTCEACSPTLARTLPIPSHRVAEVSCAQAAAVLEQVRVLRMFAFVFGIPLSVAALSSGTALGLGTRWGVFRYPWVVTKLALIVSVIAVGALVINPARPPRSRAATARRG